MNMHLLGTRQIFKKHSKNPASCVAKPVVFDVGLGQQQLKDTRHTHKLKHTTRRMRKHSIHIKHHKSHTLFTHHTHLSHTHL